MKMIALDEAGHRDQAIACIEAAIAHDPEDASRWYFKGMQLIRAKRFEEAVVAYDRSLELSSAPMTWQGRSVALEQLGRYEEAIAGLDQALLKGNSALAWVDRGRLLEQLERYEEALRSYYQAIEAEPGYRLIWQYRGALLERLERYEAALNNYCEAVEWVSDWQFYHREGRMLMRLQRYEQALFSFNDALEVQPDEPRILFDRAGCYAMQGETEKALTDLQRSIQIEPDLYRDLAKLNSELDSLRNNPDFQALVTPS